MTHRERAEARLERRREWAASRRDKAAACHAVGDPYRGDIAFNTQPGHIPERARVIAATERGFAHMDMATHHEQKAAGIERQLAHTIFSDDANAVEALRAKIAVERAQVERMKAANKIVRHYSKRPDIAGFAEGQQALINAGFTPEIARKLFTGDYAGRFGFPSYVLTNTGANIRRMEGRIVEIERNATKQAEAEAAPGGLIISGTGEYVNVRFADKPDRPVIEALKSAGFSWGGGCWSGYRERLPAIVQEMQAEPGADEISAAV